MSSPPTGRVSRPLVQKALLSGLHDAVLDFERWTKGEALSDWGAEAVLSTYCARALGKAIDGANAGASLTLEQHFGELLAWSERRGRPGRRRLAEAEIHARPSRRVDMILWNQNFTPRGVIEIKRIPGAMGLKADAKRLCDFVRFAGHAYGGSIRFGMLAVVVRMSEKASLKNQQAYYDRRLVGLREEAHANGMVVTMSKPKRINAKELWDPCLLEAVVFTFSARKVR